MPRGKNSTIPWSPKRGPAWRPRCLLLGVAVLLVGLGVAARALALEPRGPLRRYQHDVWRARHGLPSDFVRVVAQSPDGYLWIGTHLGLVRFDGSTFARPKRDPGGALETASVLALHFGRRDGTLWVGTDGAGAFLVTGFAARPLTEAPLPQARVRAIVEAADGAVLLGMATGGIWRHQAGRLSPASPEGEELNLANMAFAADATLWVTTNRGTVRLTGGNVAPVPELGKAAAARARAIHADPDGTIWVATIGAGLARVRQGAVEVFGRSAGLTSDVVAMVRDGRGRLWLSTLDQVGVWEDDRLRPAFETRDLCDRRVLDMREDADEGLWFATDGCGLHRIAERPFARLLDSDGVPERGLQSVGAMPDGSVWIGHGDGRIAVVRGDRAASLGPDEGLVGGHIQAITAGRDGAPIVTYREGPVMRLSGGRFEPVGPSPFAAAFTGVAFEDAEGALTILREGFGVLRLEGVPLREVSLPPELEGSRVLHAGARGALWAGLRRGRVGKLVGGRLTEIPVDVPGSLSALLEDRAGTLWMGFGGAGLARVAGGRTVVLDARHGVPVTHVREILEDDRGGLWLAARNGVCHLSRAELEAVADGRAQRVSAVLYGEADGVSTGTDPLGTTTAARSRDGRLWFLTVRGAVVFDPTGRPARRDPPRPVVEDLFIDGRRYDPHERPELGATKGDVRVNFTAITFDVPGSIEFRHRLDGVDDDWSPAEGRRVAHYTNLAPGRYTFEVMTRRRHGAWTTAGANVTFELGRPLHRNPWLYAACGLVFVALVVAAHRARAAAAAARLRAVVVERNRIAHDIHDSLAQSFVGVRIQLECVRRTLAADPVAAGRHLETAKSLVDGGLSEARRSVLALRPGALEGGDLPTAIKRAAAALSGSATLRLRVEGEPRPIGGALEETLFRIAQEAMTNAVRHAAAARIEITLAFAPGRVSLRVSDDGRGFVDGEGAKAGQGLAGMRHRAEQVGARFGLETGQAGTTVTVEVAA